MRCTTSSTARASGSIRAAPSACQRCSLVLLSMQRRQVKRNSVVFPLVAEVLRFIPFVTHCVYTSGTVLRVPGRGLERSRVETRFRDFAVQRQPLPDGRGSVTVELIQRELQSRGRGTLWVVSVKNGNLHGLLGEEPGHPACSLGRREGEAQCCPRTIGGKHAALHQ
jgi:hypothetical protein